MHLAFSHSLTKKKTQENKTIKTNWHVVDILTLCLSLETNPKAYTYTRISIDMERAEKKQEKLLRTVTKYDMSKVSNMKIIIIFLLDLIQ